MYLSRKTNSQLKQTLYVPQLNLCFKILFCTTTCQQQALGFNAVHYGSYSLCHISVSKW